MKKQLGVNNNNPRLELLKRTAHLNEVYDNVVLSAKALEKPIQYYRVFSQQVVGVPYTLPIISYIIGENCNHDDVFSWNFFYHIIFFDIFN